MALNGQLIPVANTGIYANISASGLIHTGPGAVAAVVVNSHTNGTLKLWDNTSAATPVIFNTITFAAGPGSYNLFGAKFITGLYATIGGTADITLIWNF